MCLFDSVHPLSSLKQCSVYPAGAHLHQPGAEDPVKCAKTSHHIEQGFSEEVWQEAMGWWSGAQGVVSLRYGKEPTSTGLLLCSSEEETCHRVGCHQFECSIVSGDGALRCSQQWCCCDPSMQQEE